MGVLAPRSAERMDEFQLRVTFPDNQKIFLKKQNNFIIIHAKPCPL